MSIRGELFNLPIWKGFFYFFLSRVLTTILFLFQALKYVSFPVQTLAKCAKMIPVMVRISSLESIHICDFEVFHL